MQILGEDYQYINTYFYICTIHDFQAKYLFNHIIYSLGVVPPVLSLFTLS